MQRNYLPVAVAEVNNIPINNCHVAHASTGNHLGTDAANTTKTNNQYIFIYKVDVFVRHQVRVVFGLASMGSLLCLKLENGSMF